MSANMQAGVTCYTTDCNAKCKKGTNSVAQMNGQPGQLSTNDRCKKGEYRTLCCDDGTFMGSCQWRGFRGAGLSCISGCADGEIEVVTDTNHHDKKGDVTCTGGLQSYCCKGFKPPPSANDLKNQAKNAAKAAAEAAAENAALDLAAKAFCRVAVPALLAPLELAEDLIPIVGKLYTIYFAFDHPLTLILTGEILDIAELAATPALINLCVKGVEKEGKAEFKVFGKKHTLSFNKPTEKPSKTRPSESSHTSAKTSSDSCPGPGGLEKRMPRPCRQTTTSHVTHNAYVAGNVVDRTCDVGLYSQPCLHYRSVARRLPGYDRLTCFTSSPAVQARPWVNSWSNQHVLGWRQAVNPLPLGGCQADEWPPVYFWQGNPAQQWIRYAPGTENRDAGQLWNRLCPKIAERHTVNAPQAEWITNKRPEARLETVTVPCSVVWTRSTISMHFDRVPAGLVDDGLPENPCYLPRLVDDPGFALLTDDPWYLVHPTSQANRARYAQPPPLGRKRDTWFDPDSIVLQDGNSTRKLTDEELKERFGFVRCADTECSHVMQELGIQSAIVVAPRLSTPVGAVAVAATTSMALPASTVSATPPEQVLSVDMPLQT